MIISDFGLESAVCDVGSDMFNSVCFLQMIYNITFEDQAMEFVVPAAASVDFYGLLISGCSVSGRGHVQIIINVGKQSRAWREHSACSHSLCL